MMEWAASLSHDPLFMLTGRHQIAFFAVIIAVMFSYVADKIKLFDLAALLLIVVSSILKGAIHFSLSLSGRSIVQLRVNLKKRGKAKITKNRSIMVVSDHNRPVQCNGIPLFRV
jgi:hypothetical protein